MILAVSACAALSAPRFDAPPSDHYNGSTFFNYEPTSGAQFQDALRKARFWRPHGHWPQFALVRTDTPPARVGPGELRVTMVNHATVLLQVDGLNILTDPVWSDRIGPVPFIGLARHRPPGIRFEDLPRIDVVLISHDHYDHLDIPTIRRLVDRFHPRIFAGLGISGLLRRAGIFGVRDIDWWKSAELAPGVRLTAVPARHWSARALDDRNRTLWLGYVIDTPSGPVYFAGDTGFTEAFTLIHDFVGGPIRLALLPIAPLTPHETMAPRHLSARDAVRAAGVLDARSAIAIHFGTFAQGDDAPGDAPDSLRAAMRDMSSPLSFLALENGDTARVAPLAPR